MPETITKETVIYTLAELKQLDPSTYKDALNKVMEWSWEGFEPSWFSDDLRMWIKEDCKSFDLTDSSLEWDMNNRWIHAKGSVRVQDFLIDHRLRNKYRTLWYWLKQLDIHFDIPCTFGFGRDNGNADTYEFQRELDCYPEITDDKARYDRIVKEVEALEGEIGNWMTQIHDRLRKLMIAEMDSRWTDEFAIEEAEALELKFTEDGDIFHG